ncbi:MAG: glycosyltransferase [Frankia sp.]
MTLVEILSAALVVLTAAHVCGVLLLGIELFRPRWSRPAAPVAALICFAVAALFAVGVGIDEGSAFLMSAVGFLVVNLAMGKLTNLRPSGVITYATVLMASVSVVPLLFGFFSDLGLSGWTRASLLASTAATTFLTPSILTQTFEGWDPILRQRWRRPSGPMVDWVMTSDAPMVSIHVPAHAEPPELVIATLDALARLDYPNYEVLLVDNNTLDESLWRPVKDHCARLGPRFRFLHVEGITGAKAGALNWSRPFTDPTAELIAFVDADYQVDPRWLAHTVGYLEDPEIGFVQCPHAYRDFEHSRFGKMANGAYALFMYTEMVSLNEHGAGITVGTMSVIRLSALDAARGWAEWCMTEDSELAIRIHALGYLSVYVKQPYGWGVIPETFGAFKKQRFRWTYGPGQELREHHRLYLPGRKHKLSKLTPRQRLHHFNHGFSIFMLGTKLLTVPLQFATLVSLIVHREVIPANLALLFPIAAILLARHVMRWYLYSKVIGSTFSEFLGANLVLMSLSYVMCFAGFGLLIGRPVRWERTNKFRVKPDRFRAFRNTRAEIGLAVGYAGIAVVFLVRLPMSGLVPFLALALFWQGVIYATSPLVAGIAERDLHRPRIALTERWRPAQVIG